MFKSTSQDYKKIELGDYSFVKDYKDQKQRIVLIIQSIQITFMKHFQYFDFQT